MQAEPSMLLNPYVAGNPLRDKSAFVGRADIVRDINQMLRHPDEKVMVLYGQRRIGKSTILLQIEQQLQDKRDFTPVFFDLQDKASSPLPEILYKLGQVIADRLNQPLPARSRFDPEGDYFRNELLPQALRAAAPGGLVLLFDEFDVLDDPKDQENDASKDFFPFLKELISDPVKLKFLFVIGRRPDDLRTKTLSAFKAARSTKVSLLDRESTEAVIRRSEASGSLTWDSDAVARVWTWTHGHAYFTQLICTIVWDKLDETRSGQKVVRARVEDVDYAIPTAFRHGAHAFQWIWGGLPPAERVVMAAMATVKDETISEEQIEEALNSSGVQLIARELKIAPGTLVDWELLRLQDHGYTFAVPLLQNWVRQAYPLAKVKEELGRLDPLADNLYQSSKQFYELGSADEAAQLLRQALRQNPNHVRSRLLLARILLEKGQIEGLQEAVQVLEEGYKYDKVAVGSDLVKVRLALESFQQEEEEKLRNLQRILEVDPHQSIARVRSKQIWQARGMAAMQKGNYEEAVNAFTLSGDEAALQRVRVSQNAKWNREAEQALAANDLDRAMALYKLTGNQDKIAYVNQWMDRQWCDMQLAQADAAEARGEWKEAIDIYNVILKRYPDNQAAHTRLTKAGAQAALRASYNQALELLTPRYASTASVPAQQKSTTVSQTSAGATQAASPNANAPVTAAPSGTPWPIKWVIIAVSWFAIFGCVSLCGSFGAGVAQGLSTSSGYTDMSGIVTLASWAAALLLAFGGAGYLTYRLFRKQPQPGRRRS
jgi:tetratricopeptide (TPR) repeat protein